MVGKAIMKDTKPEKLKAPPGSTAATLSTPASTADAAKAAAATSSATAAKPTPEPGSEQSYLSEIVDEMKKMNTSLTKNMQVFIKNTEDIKKHASQLVTLSS